MSINVLLFCLTGIIISVEAILGTVEEYPMLNTLRVCVEGSSSSFVSCAFMLRINMVPARGFHKDRNISLHGNSTCVYVTHENATDPKENPRCLMTGVFSPNASGGEVTWEPVTFHFFNKVKDTVGVPVAVVYWGAQNDPRGSVTYTPMPLPNSSNT